MAAIDLKSDLKFSSFILPAQKKLLEEKEALVSYLNRLRDEIENGSFITNARLDAIDSSVTNINSSVETIENDINNTTSESLVARVVVDLETAGPTTLFTVPSLKGDFIPTKIISRVLSIGTSVDPAISVGIAATQDEFMRNTVFKGYTRTPTTNNIYVYQPNGRSIALNGGNQLIVNHNVLASGGAFKIAISLFGYFEDAIS